MALPRRFPAFHFKRTASDYETKPNQSPWNNNGPLPPLSMSCFIWCRHRQRLCSAHLQDRAIIHRHTRPCDAASGIANGRVCLFRTVRVLPRLLLLCSATAVSLTIKLSLFFTEPSNVSCLYSQVLRAGLYLPFELAVGYSQSDSLDDVGKLLESIVDVYKAMPLLGLRPDEDWLWSCQSD